MLNEDKIKVMNKLAMYEKTEGKKYLPVSKYYRSDYIGLALIKNFFLVTIGYVLVVAAVGVYFGDFLMDNIHKMDLRALGESLLVGYVVLMVVYILLTLLIYNVRYFRAKKGVKEYYRQLTKLDKMYVRDERKGGRRR
jgi:hypothetical protein